MNLKVISYVYFEMGKIEEAIKVEGTIMRSWTQSMKSNSACLKYLTNENTRKFAYTVFYALVGASKLRKISEWLLENPETTRETRIREFAGAMWSSGHVSILQLEPERYDAVVAYIRDNAADVTIGEFCAIDEYGNALGLQNCQDVLLQHYACAENKDKCLVIVRPMPPVDRKPLELLPAFCEDPMCGPPVTSAVQSPKGKFSKICTIL